MSSPEHNIETLIIAILAANADLTTVDIEHDAEDESTVAKLSRIEVKCEPPTPLVDARKLSITPYAWQAQVTITAKAKGTDTSWDIWRAAIDAAILGSVPAGVTTAADADFSWLELDAPTGGGVSEGDRRMLTRQLRAVFRT